MIKWSHCRPQVHTLTQGIYFSNSTLQKKFQGSEKGEDQPDRSAAAHHGANERGGERGHRPAQDTKNTGTEMSSQHAGGEAGASSFVLNSTYCE